MMTSAPHSTDAHSHIPVMLTDVLAALAPTDGEHYLDATFGAGGYSDAILRAANCHLTAMDRDPNVANHVERIRAAYGDRFTFLPHPFSLMAQHVAPASLDAIIMDIGVSSMQIDEATRGFSFRYNAPLDMRMSGTGHTAADIVNNTDETELANILWRYGEERASRRIARVLVAARVETPITTTRQLRELVHSVHSPYKGQKIDPATRTFQALRIAVNDELGELQTALDNAPALLREGGRLIVVSFHSLEDRIVKQYMRDKSSTGESISRHIPDLPDAIRTPLFTLHKRKAITAAADETSRNPRARSAKMRVAIRTDAAVDLEVNHG